MATGLNVRLPLHFIAMTNSDDDGGGGGDNDDNHTVQLGM
jgi:hypothetical protein